MKRPLLLALAAVVLIGMGIWWFSPTQVVKRRTLGLLNTVTLEEGSGRATRNMGVYSLNSYLAPRVRLEIPSVNQADGTFDRADLEAGFSSMANQAKQAKFEVKEILDITVEGDKGSVTLLLDVLVEFPNYRPADGTYEVIFDWRRGDDGWRLNRAKWVEE